VLLQKLALIVDDSNNDALLLKLMLKRAGIGNPVKILDDGVQAIAYLGGEGEYADRTKSPLPAILFLDLKMPVMSGYEVLEWLQGRPEFKPILVIALSGWAQMTDVNRAYQLGAQSFLSKPFTVADLHNLQKDFPDYWTKSPGSGSDGKAPPSTQAHGG
jgi:CheY-like chemotaxis protein